MSGSRSGGTPMLLDPTVPGCGPYAVFAMARSGFPGEAPQTYGVAARQRPDGRAEWWNNFMTREQATALCAALNWWWSAYGAREPRGPRDAAELLRVGQGEP